MYNSLRFALSVYYTLRLDGSRRIGPSNSTQSRFYLLLLLDAGLGRRQQAAPLLTALAATHGSLLGPTAVDARTTPNNSGRAAVRDCSCWTEVRRRYCIHADRRVDNRTSLGGSPPVLRRTRPPFPRPLLASRAPALLLRAAVETYDPLRSPGYCARTAPNSKRAPQETASAGRRSCPKLPSTRD